MIELIKGEKYINKVILSNQLRPICRNMLRPGKFCQCLSCWIVAPFAQNSGFLVPYPHFLIHLKLCTSRLCMKMSSFMYASACAMPRTLYWSCGILFSLWTPDNISGLTSFMVWLSRWEVVKKIQVISFYEGGQNCCWARGLILRISSFFSSSSFVFILEVIFIFQVVFLFGLP